MSGVTYRVCYSYADQFGHERREAGPHYRERVNAELWAATMFISIKPDAWWIERVETIEFHTKEA